MAFQQASNTGALGVIEVIVEACMSAAAAS